MFKFGKMTLVFITASVAVLQPAFSASAQEKQRIQATANLIRS